MTSIIEHQREKKTIHFRHSLSKSNSSKWFFLSFQGRL